MLKKQQKSKEHNDENHEKDVNDNPDKQTTSANGKSPAVLACNKQTANASDNNPDKQAGSVNGDSPAAAVVRDKQAGSVSVKSPAALLPEKNK